MKLQPANVLQIELEWERMIYTFGFFIIRDKRDGFVIVCKRLKALWAPVQEGVSRFIIDSDNRDFWKALNIHVCMPR